MNEKIMKLRELAFLQLLEGNREADRTGTSSACNVEMEYQGIVGARGTSQSNETPTLSASR